jgi:hypothetical protein
MIYPTAHSLILGFLITIRRTINDFQVGDFLEGEKKKMESFVTDSTENMMMEVLSGSEIERKYACYKGTRNY